MTPRQIAEAGVVVAVLSCTVVVPEPATPTRSTCDSVIATRLRAIGEDYRAPQPSDVTGKWAYIAEEYGREAYCVAADANGDGLKDLFFVLPKTRPRGGGLFADVSAEGARLQQLREFEQPVQQAALGWLEPGSYRELPLCSGAPEPISPLSLKLGGIDWILENAHGVEEHVVFYWESQVGAIKQRVLCRDQQPQGGPGMKP